MRQKVITHCVYVCVSVCVPALAALSGCLLVLAVELSQQLRGFLLVPPHQLLQLLELASLLLLVNLGLLQTLHGARRDVCGRKRARGMEGVNRPQ